MDSIDQSVHVSIRHLQEQVRQLRKKQKLLESIIDPELGKYVKVSSQKKQTLVLVVDNASIATHIKMMAPDIIEGIKARAPELSITAIQCKIRKPKEDPYQQKHTRVAHMSEKAAQHISNAASGIKNSRLKEALEKLSLNAKS